jgi:hypothetical protein
MSGLVKPPDVDNTLGRICEVAMAHVVLRELITQEDHMMRARRRYPVRLAQPRFSAGVQFGGGIHGNVGRNAFSREVDECQNKPRSP